MAATRKRREKHTSKLLVSHRLLVPLADGTWAWCPNGGCRIQAELPHRFWSASFHQTTPLVPCRGHSTSIFDVFLLAVDELGSSGVKIIVDAGDDFIFHVEILVLIYFHIAMRHAFLVYLLSLN